MLFHQASGRGKSLGCEGWHTPGRFRREPHHDVVQVGAQHHRRFSLLLGVAVLLHQDVHQKLGEPLHRPPEGHGEEQGPENIPLLNS